MGTLGSVVANGEVGAEVLCGQVPALALTGVTCQRKSLKASGKIRRWQRGCS